MTGPVPRPVSDCRRRSASDIPLHIFLQGTELDAYRGLAVCTIPSGLIPSMESLLVKIFALALALSQVTTTPDAVKTQFDRTRDQEEVARLLGAGCTHMRKPF